MTTLIDFVPEDVTFTFNGVQVKGFASDTFITARRNTPNTAAEVGADGTVGITRRADRTGELELTLMQNAESNRQLAYLQNIQDLGNLVRGDITIVDPSGGFIMIAKSCHIMEPAEISLGSDQNSRTWKFFAERIDYTNLPAGMVEMVAEAVRIAQAGDAAVQISDAINDALRGLGLDIL